MSDKLTILYVDDEEFNLTSFKAIFRRDYNILTAISGKMGLEILKEHPVQLIITDQRMPDMTGVEFLEMIADDYMFVRRIIITGFSDMEAIIRAINRGNIYRYITKPWDVNDLKITIANAINAYITDTKNRNLTIELQKQIIQIEELGKEQIRLQEERYRQEAEKLVLESESNKLKEIQKIREEISNMIVHDLKNPLGLVIGYAKMAEEQFAHESPNLATLKMYFASIENAGNSMLNLTMNLLDVYRFESGAPKLKFMSMTMDEIVNSLLEKVSYGLSKKKLEIVKEYEKDHKISVDRDLIVRVLVNLMTNAIKFTPSAKKIYISSRINGDMTTISLRDEGAGIPADRLEQLFKRFSQVQAVDDAQGIKSTGIGLTFVKYAIEAHRGRVWVESVEGNGSTFGFDIPTVQQE